MRRGRRLQKRESEVRGASLAASPLLPFPVPTPAHCVMSNIPPPETMSDTLRRLAGYVNFSSGTSDPATLAAWNDVYGAASRGDPMTGPAAWLVVKDWLCETLAALKEDQPAFRDCQQAQRVIALLWSELLPAYLDFHRDLLFHQEPELLFNGFFMARAADALLSVGLDGDTSSVVQAAIDRMDTFVGYRPVAILENRNCQPYRHEFACPVPLYVRDAGVSAGPYRDIITLAIEALRETDDEILRAASFDPDRMAELSLDPRAYDFDHPVNRRPNYHFGGWDERSITQDGYFDRFVIRQVTLDALLSRLRDEPGLNPDELMSEAATVLAGTILMASGISGWGPGAYTSDITLGSLMKPIAAYRDAYYEDRLAQINGDHAERLAGRTETASPALWCSPTASKRRAGDAPSSAAATCPAGAAVRPHGLPRCGDAANRYGCRSISPDDVPHRLRDDAGTAIDSSGRSRRRSQGTGRRV